MTDTTASALAGCNEDLALMGVTREFDFGQFIELFDSTPDPNHPDDPVVSRIVIKASSTLAADRGATSSTSSPLVAAVPGAGNGNGSGPIRSVGGAGGRIASVVEPEVHLFDLTERGPGAKLAPVDAQIKNPEAFFKTGKLAVDGKTLEVPIDDAMRDSLSKGFTVTTFAQARNGTNRGSLPVRLALPFEHVTLGQDDVARVLAGGRVATAAGDVKPVLDAEAIRTLLAGNSVLTHGIGPTGITTPVELKPTGNGQHPLDARFDIFDLPAFIANPAVVGSRGETLPVELDAGHIRQLIDDGRTTLPWQETSLELTAVAERPTPDVEGYRTFVKDFHPAGSDGGILPTVKPPGLSWEDIAKLGAKYASTSAYFVNTKQPGATWKDPGTKFGGKTGLAGTDLGGGTDTSITAKVQPRLPTGTGLPVAVFVPWKQTWALKGFSRGNLLHSLALAPMEEVTLQVFSWERRSRSLEQSSETEVEQSTETSNTTRDTEDVFKEMISKRDFAWQLSGSLDASYSTGVASIKVGVNGSVNDTTSIQQTARNSSQQVRESTIKASARVRSRRVTRITQTVETGREEKVTRVIRNPNQCYTLTLDFFEALAHYEIRLEFVPQRMRLVVLVPNPIQYPEFKSEVVRRNETTLRNALVEDALVDGFEACKFVAAYEEAKILVGEQKAQAAKEAELATQRDKPPAPQSPDPAAPQQAELERIASGMVAAIQQIRADSEIDSAMRAIRDHNNVTEAMRRSGQYWLFINFCASKFPALLAALDDLSKDGTPGSVANAQRLMSVLPKAEAPTNLGNLNEISDQEKELAGISSKIREPAYLGSGIWWGWWTGRMHEEGLYTANDAGLGGLADQLPKAFKDWEAKKAQGGAMKDQDVAKTEAEGRQDKASSDDKLTMSFPLDELARAYERQKVLRDHLNEHREFYNYALFQALPPSEQALRIVEASQGKLQVGLFEPRVVAMNGSRLAVPLTPLAGVSTLKDFVDGLKVSLQAAFDETDAGPDTAILPTPGVSVSTRLGQCSSCEEYIDKAREYELQRLQALAQQETWEVTRRQRRIEDGKDFADFVPAPAAVKLEVTNPTPNPNP